VLNLQLDRIHFEQKGCRRPIVAILYINGIAIARPS